MIDERDVREMLRRRAESIPALPTDPVGAVRRARRRVPVTVGVAIVTSAALILGAVAGVGSLLRATEPTPGDQGRTALPSTPEAWSRVVLEPGQQVNAITSGGPGLVAVGSDDAGPVAWTSSDGRTWTKVEIGGDGEMVDAVATPAGIVAVGFRLVGPEEPAGVVWTSRDGVSWAPSSDPAFEGASLSFVATTDPGVVAFGTTPDGPRAWYSADGAEWTRASLPRPPGEEAGFDVADVGDRLIAVPVGSDPFPEGSVIAGVSDGPAGLVAVGMYRYRQEAGVWISDDGSTWQRVPPQQEAFVSHFPGGFPAAPDQGGFYASPYHRGGPLSVTSNKSGYVAVGADGLCGSGPCLNSEAAVWTSTDGQVWARVPSGPVFQSDGSEEVIAVGVVAWGSRFVAWGSFGDGTPAIWVSDAPEE